MSQVINTNVLSLNAQRNLNNSQGALAQSLERLSSGLRINSAKDDAAGLAIAERFTTQIRGLNQAVRNANDGISFAQTAEGALGTVGDAMQRIRELAVQSANDTNSASDRQALNNEVEQLVQEINRVSNSTEFNGTRILDGSLEDLIFQVGANRNQTISVDGVDARGSQLGGEVIEGDAVSLNAVTGGAAGASISEGDLADITVNGVEIDLSEATSLDDVVNAINQEFGDTGVQAVRTSGVETANDLGFTDPSAAGAVEINGVSISIADTDGVADIAESINERSSQTGVTASVDNGQIVFESDADIEVSVIDGGDLVIAGIGSGESDVFARGIELQAEIGTGIDVAGTDDTELGLEGVASQDFTLNGVSVATREGATDTIRTIDLALQQVNGLRAELGSVQVRFENTISNLEISSENLSAARSRIQDADFAAETAELTRAQVLQQAGTSVLSQANAVPQNVLALLQ
ncbi:flagellin [Thioalkalivibrio sp. ALMg13-2]|uniref:flagellin N-terminal helical domain-containing protein n=1 Tax=Thioalkalivibrio sp. ALMg13-2 TaxID=1158167 RepID=UPI0003712137|nr:flagellin [Thioalkalivibrio sp. ALMg13-2]